MSIIVSILQGGTNSHTTTSEEANAYATDFVGEGVVGATTNTAGVAPATGAFAVNAQGTPDMTVAVSAGVAYVIATPTSGNSQTLRVRNTATSNVTISSNSTGGTRYDWVYIKVDPDKAKDPAADASDVATLTTSRSTSNTTDNGTPPTYSYPIAIVTVANGASSITNGNITDIRARTGSDSRATSADTEAVATSQTTTSTSYTDLSTSGPAVSITVPASGKVSVSIYALLQNSATNAAAYMGFALSGANTVAASDAYSIYYLAYANNANNRHGAYFLLEGLTPGLTTFTAKYKASANTATFQDRRIAVEPK